MTHTAKAIKLKQNDYEFFLTTLSVNFLHKACSTNIAQMDVEGDVYQRRLNKSRVLRIAGFARRSRAVFPTAVVLNSKLPLKYVHESMELFLPEEEDSFFVIDGQHRIEGVYESGNDLDMCVVIMNCVDLDMQSELFITINSEQKAVNPNVRFSIKSNDKYITPEKMICSIAKLFNNDPQSPFFERIWMDDTPRRRGQYTLSLSAFCEPLCEYIYSRNMYYNLKDCLYSRDGNKGCLTDFNDSNAKYILWPFYLYDADKILYKILLNYFVAIKNVYSDVWYDTNSCIVKTTGYNAFMLLFKSLFMYCKQNGNDFSYARIYKILNENKIDSEEFDSKRAGLGRAAAYELFSKLRPKTFERVSIDEDFMMSLSEDTIEYYL